MLNDCSSFFESHNYGIFNMVELHIELFKKVLTPSSLSKKKLNFSQLGAKFDEQVDRKTSEECINVFPIFNEKNSFSSSVCIVWHIRTKPLL